MKPFRRAAVLLTLVVVVGVLFPVVWQEARALRGRSLANKAENAMGAGDRRTAANLLAAATRLAPDDSTVLRALARYDFLQGDPRAISLWIKLVEKDRGSSRDWEGLLQSALQKRDRVLSVRALEGFRKAAPQERVKAKKYECRVLQLWDKTQAAADVAEELLASGEADTGFNLFACELLLRGNERQRSAAMGRLWKWAEDPGSDGMAGLIILARSRGLSKDEQGNIAERLRKHPLSGWEARVLAESMDIDRGARGPASTAWTRFGRALPDDERIRTARWLANMGHARLASGLVDREEARARSDALFVYLDILGAEERWAELLAFLENPPPVLPAVLHRAYQSRGAEKMGNAPLSDRYWKLALASARNDPSSSSHLANYAAVLGWNDRARELCRDMAETPGSEVQGLLGLLGLAKRDGNPVAEKEVLVRLRAKAPHLFPDGATLPAAGLPAVQMPGDFGVP